MSENFVNPTYYNLQRAIIRSEFSNIGELDITSLIPALTINSSIDSDAMFGQARVVDSVGLLSGEGGRDPLRGEEQIILEIADSKTINENGGLENGVVAEPFRFVGYLYKIGNVQTKAVNDAVTYDIHFVSYQAFKASTFELIRAFIDERCSDIVRKIFDDYYINPAVIGFVEPSERKRLILEETEGVIRCWLPKLKPEEAMNFLSKRSYSANDSPSCLFRFFESSRGFHYITDEQLIRLATDQSESDYDKDRLFQFTYLDAIPDTLEFFEQQLNNFEMIENTDRVNSFDDIFNGAYRNKVYELDILSRRLNLLDDSNQYDYFDNREKYQQAPSRFQRLVDRHTTNFIESVHRDNEGSVQKKWLVVQNFTEGEKSGENAMQAETYYAEIISNRTAYAKHIESITVTARGAGRLDITAGDIIELKVQEFKLASGEGSSGAFIDNKHLSGRYIVRSVSHEMEHEEMFNSYVLIKRDWSQTEVDQNAVSDEIVGRAPIGFGGLSSSASLPFILGSEVDNG
jgi:hypothetical protein